MRAICSCPVNVNDTLLLFSIYTRKTKEGIHIPETTSVHKTFLRHFIQMLFHMKNINKKFLNQFVKHGFS